MDIKEKIREKLKQRAVFCAGYKYIKYVRKGFVIYQDLLREYGKDTAFLVHGWPGMGDIFLLHEYLPYFLQKHGICKYVVLVQGKAAKQTVDLFKIPYVELLSEQEKAALTSFKMFTMDQAENLVLLHHDPPGMHIRIGNKLQGIHQSTTRDMLLYACLGLENENIKPGLLPSFEEQDGYVQKLFQKKKLIPHKTVILSPYVHSCQQAFPMQTWVRLAVTLKELGFCVCTNCAGKEERPVKGTVALRFPLKYSVPVLELAGYFIGMRSGFCDVAGMVKCKKYIIYRGENMCGNNKESRYFSLNKIGLSKDAKEYAPMQIQIRITMGQILADLAADADDSEIKQLTVSEGNSDRKLLQPAFGKNNIALAFSVSNEYVPYLTVTLESIIDHMQQEHNYDILILEDDLTYDSKNMLRKAYGIYENVSIRFIDISYYLSKYTLYTWGWYRPIMYGRLLLPTLLQNYEKVLYLDCDLILLTDVAELFQTKMNETELIAAVRDVGMINTYHIPGAREKDYFEKDIRLKNPDGYINSGVILFHIQPFNKKYTAKQIFDHAASRQWMWQDQDIIMTLFEGHIRYLDQAWNVMIQSEDTSPDLMGPYAPAEIQKAYREARNAPKLIHYIANKHLWLDPLPDLFAYYWKYAKKSPFYEVILFRAIKRSS